MSDAEVARRILRCLDLTDVSENCSEHGTAALCAKALTPHGPVAAVCVWPQMVSLANAGVQGSSVRVATVVNFPGGEDDLERVGDDIDEALGAVREAGLQLIDKQPRRGIRDSRVAFLHPKSTGGVLTELVEPAH